MKWRNLRLLAIDDDNTIEPPLPLIDFLHLKEWEDHLELLAGLRPADTAVYHSFDLLSVDINYQNESGNPWAGSAAPVHNCAGLYHGMVALAQREQRDEYGNRLTLAWELRSVNPAQFNDPALKWEATRAYGLLRAMMARPRMMGRPRKKESLLDCLVREREASSEHRRRVSPAAASKLASVMLDELVARRTQQFEEAHARLLTKWRRLFFEDVRDRVIPLRKAQIEDLHRRLKKERYVPVSETDEDGFEVCDRNEQAGENYGLRLGSVFADLVSEGKLDVVEPFDSLAARKGGEPRPVLDWVLALMNACSEVGREVLTDEVPADNWLPLARFVHAVLTGKAVVNADGSWWETRSPGERVFVYCVAWVGKHLGAPHYDFRWNKGLKGLATRLNLPDHDHTFTRPVEEQHWGMCLTPTELRNELDKHLRGESTKLFSDKRFLRRALRQFCLDPAGLHFEAAVLDARAQGLVLP